MSKWDWNLSVADWNELGGWLRWRWELADKSGNAVASGWAMTRSGALLAGWLRRVWWTLS